jgi:hypothetical protein
VEVVTWTLFEDGWVSVVDRPLGWGFACGPVVDSLIRVNSIEGTYVPPGWTGKMSNGDVINASSTFLSIRSFYKNDPEWPKVQSYLDGGPAPSFTYHRFWAQAEIAMAFSLHAQLFG